MGFGDTKDVSRADGLARDQEVSPPCHCIVHYGGLPYPLRTPEEVQHGGPFGSERFIL